MTFTISKDFEWSASHQLVGLPPEHPCSRMHGHNYVARVQLQGDTLDAGGFLLDYRELAPIKRWVDDTLDHRHLNDALHTDMPTAELMARYLAGLVVNLAPVPEGVLVAVAVSETPKTWATFTPAGWQR